MVTLGLLLGMNTTSTPMILPASKCLGRTEGFTAFG
jgi:hypothetical protein